MNSRTLWIISAACAAVLLCIPPGTVRAAPSPADVGTVVERAMADFGVPGMSVAVVHGGAVAYAAGHGVVEHGSATAVTDATLFRIGSVSKAFTAAALALLADDGALGLDDRVIDHLPEFRMQDPWVTREFTIRDLLTHRSGLPLGAGDLLIFPEGTATVDEIVRALRHLKPTSSFRAKYDYDNLLYIVAGEVVARASGLSFTEFLERRLLRPLGMGDCVATAARAAPDAVLAMPHVRVDDAVQTTGAGISVVSAAAGGVACSARSMARWMAFVLARGRTADGEELISGAQFDELLKPVTPLPVPPWQSEHAGSFLAAYALGWTLSTFYGEPMVAHGGAVWGMTTYLMLLPARGLAVFASGNLMSPAPRAVVYQIADGFLADVSAQAGKDWLTIIAGIQRERRDEGEKTVAEAEASRVAGSTPSLPLQAYSGIYRDPWYGAVHLSVEDDGRLWFRSERNAPLRGPLEHFQFDTFIARWTDRQLMADAYVSFSLSPEGAVERIRMKAVSPATDFSYDFHDLDLVRVE